jgi:hypothetical protein
MWGLVGITWPLSLVFAFSKMRRMYFFKHSVPMFQSCKVCQQGLQKLFLIIKTQYGVKKQKTLCLIQIIFKGFKMIRKKLQAKIFANSSFSILQLS